MKIPFLTFPLRWMGAARVGSFVAAVLLLQSAGWQSNAWLVLLRFASGAFWLWLHWQLVEAGAVQRFMLRHCERRSRIIFTVETKAGKPVRIQDITVTEAQS